MRNIVLLILGAINLLANIPYIVNTYRGKTKPDIATWSTWALLNAVAAVAAIQSGAYNTVMLAVSYLAGSFSVLLLAFRKGKWNYSLLDGVCQVLALVGVAFWLAARNPTIAIVFVVLVDVLAAIPSLRHARVHPREETWITYYVAGIVSLGLVACADSYSLASLAYPIDNVVINLLLTWLIVSGRRRRRIASGSRQVKLRGVQ